MEDKTTLENLLQQLSTGSIDNDKLQSTFKEVAHELMGRFKLMVGETGYQIKEIEFYYWNPSNEHKDPFIDGWKLLSGCRQANFGEWYFSGYKKQELESYKSYRYGRVDITFGNKEHNNIGGILIRAIRKVGGSTVISGPNNVVKEIIGALVTQTNIENVFDVLAFGNENSVFNPSSILTLVPHAFNGAYCQATTRHGLSKTADPDHAFRNKDYRFIEISHKYQFPGKEKAIVGWLIDKLINQDEEKFLCNYNRKKLNDLR